MIEFFQLPLALVVLTLALAFAAPSTAFTDAYFFGSSAGDTGNNGPIDAIPSFPSSFGYDPDRWTNTGKKLRLAGRGLPKRGSGEEGDLFAIVQIVVPSELTEREKTLFKDLADSSQFDPRAALAEGDGR